MQSDLDGTTAVEAREMQEVTIYFRRPGPRGPDPHGIKKMTVMQPRGCESWWRQARQFRTPHLPNVAIVIDGRAIIPRPIAPDADAAELLDDQDIADLEARRALLRQECARLEVQLETLQEMHRETRAHYLAEEKALHEALGRQREQLAKARAEYDSETGKMHERWSEMLRQEQELTEAMNARIATADAQLLETLRERGERTKAIEQYARESVAALEGTTAERLFERACERVRGAAENPLVQELLLGFARKHGIK